MKYLLQNIFVFCEFFCAGQWDLIKFQRVYVRSISFKTRMAMDQLLANNLPKNGKCDRRST